MGEVGKWWGRVLRSTTWRLYDLVFIEIGICLVHCCTNRWLRFSVVGETADHFIERIGRFWCMLVLADTVSTSGDSRR